VIRITFPHNHSFQDYRQLRAYADWYLGEVARHGPSYGSKRFPRRARARERSAKHIAATQVPDLA